MPLGPQAPILGVSVCLTILGCMCYYIRLRVLLYLVACATILGCVCYYIRLRVLGVAVYSGPKGPCPPHFFTEIHSVNSCVIVFFLLFRL